MALKVFNRYTLILSVLLVICGIYLHLYIDNVSHYLLSLIVGKKHVRTNLFTKEELAQYNGIIKETIYLAILGSVFDVSNGKKHYEKGSSYHFFAGKDGSRSFITGEFNKEAGNVEHDHVMDLTCDELDALKNWKDTYKKRYISKGKLIGRYYDENGMLTPYSKELKIKLNQCITDKTVDIEFKKKYPPCNMEWNVDSNTRVWCTNNSGGIARGWVGVPRQLYTPGDKKPRCVCVEVGKDTSETLKEYENCAKTSISCNVDNIE